MIDPTQPIHSPFEYYEARDQAKALQNLSNRTEDQDIDLELLLTQLNEYHQKMLEDEVA